MLRSFPRPRHTWRQKFDPCLLAWAGAQEDVYDVDSEERVSVEIANIWESLYPGEILEDNEFFAVVTLVRPSTKDSTVSR